MEYDFIGIFIDDRLRPPSHDPLLTAFGGIPPIGPNEPISLSCMESAGGVFGGVLGPRGAGCGDNEHILPSWCNGERDLVRCRRELSGLIDF